jgi:hypothetical protein
VTEPTHHIETSVEDGTEIWRWECFTCRVESQPFESQGVAELASETHAALPVQPTSDGR